MSRVLNFNEVYDLLTEVLGVPDSVISYALCYYGRNIQTIDSIVWWACGYTFKQWYNEEVSDEPIEVSF